MKEFTVSQVLEYSKNIEQESYDFYKSASAVLKDAELKELVLGLADEELKHYNRINKLLEKAALTAEMLDKRIGIKEEDYDHLVGSRELPENPTALSILETAYLREVKTESVYRTLLSFTDLADSVVDTFTELVAQEKGHASRIKSIMQKYT